MNPYWKSPNDRNPAHGDEFLEAPAEFSRRNFLKAAGFTALTVALAGCERSPVAKAIPFVKAPEELVPGHAIHYASVCTGCEAGCGALIKTIDGRPIKMEGLPSHPLSRGGLCAIGQASLLGLYDSHRFQQPLLNGQPATWDAVDAAVKSHLTGNVRVLTRTIVSPTTRAVVQKFVDSIPGAKLVVYDPLSCSAILDAHEQTHGMRVLPRYRFENARVIVSFGADFLGTWISPVEYTAGYMQGRKLDDKTLWHAQFEPTMTLTGSNADQRYRIAPGEVGHTLTQLAGKIAGKAGVAFNAPAGGQELDEVAERLWNARGQSLVVCDAQDVAAQVLVNFINDLLGNYGHTLDLEVPSLQKQGDDRALAELARELSEGKVGTLIIAGGNPVYERALPVEKAGFVICFAQRADETTAKAQVICAESNEFESWSDAEPVAGIIGIRQPVIMPRGQTRVLIETLTAWQGAPKPAYDIVHEYWQDKISWEKAVEAGFAEVAQKPVAVKAFNRPVVKPVAAQAGGLALVGYAKVGLGDGRHAYNPWLQELPDPVSKVTWDNYACLSVTTAGKLGVVEGDVVRIEAGGAAVELPVYVQPGQHDDVVAVAVAYGQQSTTRFGDVGPRWFERNPTLGPNGLIGVNVAPLLPAGRLVATGVKLSKTGKRRELAASQTHHYITVPARLAPATGLVRPCVQETTLAVYRKDPAAGIEKHPLPQEDLYPPDHPYRGRHWAMVIDLTKCTGCSACVIACQAENNIPVVGRDEVQRRREMHWMRIDRYYKGDGDEVTVAHQPMLCQHCDNAPCESVCPVLATVHTEEGLNAQVYNRCVGTRYCANNCPYKVRRFNWFNYRHDDPVENLVLNPDVTVRSRGVMEKCSFCVQRIQEATVEAKKDGKLPPDGVIQPACQQSCPAQAIVFGDRNDPNSAVAKALKDPRRYFVLEELNVKPSIGYLTLVRDRAADEKETAHHA
jgi:molybdopterin-containing oxidoreductase family iron-sulfur binding subunit